MKLTLLNADGTERNCVAATTFFPYSGLELFQAGLRLNDGNFVGVGMAETCGFGNQVPVFAKYSTVGDLLIKVTEPDVSFTGASCIGGSDVLAATQDATGSALYFAGYSSLTGSGEDGNHRPVLLRYTTDLNRTWKVRESTIQGEFDAVSVQGDAIYVAGTSSSGGFVGSYDSTGNKRWSVDMGSSVAALRGGLALPERLYVVGTIGTGATRQAVLVEIDAATGMEVSRIAYGGQPSDANAVALDGTDLVVVGSGGDGVGSDVLFARFSLQAIR